MVRKVARKIAGNAPMSNFAVMQALPRIADLSQSDGLFVESLISSIAQGDEAAKEKKSALQKISVLNLNYRQGPDVPQFKYGFADSHFICFPYETRRTGIYAAGCVRQPAASSRRRSGLGRRRGRRLRSRSRSCSPRTTCSPASVMLFSWTFSSASKRGRFARACSMNCAASSPTISSKVAASVKTAPWIR